MSVKSIGYRSFSTVANDYQFPLIKLSTANQVIQIEEDTSLTNLTTSIATVQAEADALLTLATDLDTEIGTLITDEATLTASIDTQSDQLLDIQGNISQIEALVSILQPPINIAASINSRDDNLEVSAFQPNAAGDYGVFETIGIDGDESLGYSLVGTGDVFFVIGLNVNLTWYDNPDTGSEDEDYLKSGAKLLIQVVDNEGTIVYQTKQGMFSFTTSSDNNSNVAMSATDVVALPVGTYTYTASYYVSTQTQTPESTGQPTLLAQTSWLDTGYYSEIDIKSVQGFTFQYEAILYSL
jgi:hypothetical protein|tara:strand:- start:1867 stop:2757 length:891 start_codon:yes stop_codon:yes gene_type:complete